MPFGRNSTTPISIRPIQKYQYCGFMPESRSRATMYTMAPTTPPYSRPVPPITRITISSAERSKLSAPSETNCVVWASSPPAMPAIVAAIV